MLNDPVIYTDIGYWSRVVFLLLFVPFFLGGWGGGGGGCFFLPFLFVVMEGVRGGGLVVFVIYCGVFCGGFAREGC